LLNINIYQWLRLSSKRLDSSSVSLYQGRTQGMSLTDIETKLFDNELLDYEEETESSLVN
ncbi:hypothetical protein Bhyg_07838, partial [Pseudolycoriella hygida]